MQIEIYFSYSFLNTESPIQKIIGQGSVSAVDDKKTTTKAMYKKGWKLTHAIKTSQSAQLESFNFLLIFEK